MPRHKNDARAAARLELLNSSAHRALSDRLRRLKARLHFPHNTSSLRLRNPRTDAQVSPPAQTFGLGRNAWGGTRQFFCLSISLDKHRKKPRSLELLRRHDVDNFEFAHQRHVADTTRFSIILSESQCDVESGLRHDRGPRRAEWTSKSNVERVTLDRLNRNSGKFGRSA